MAGITFTFSSGVADSVFGKSQAPIKMFLETRGEAFEQDSAIGRLFSVTPTKNWGEKFTTMTAMEGFMPVGENGAYPKDEMREGFDKVLTPITWKDSFDISAEAVEDTKTIDFKKKPQGFIKGYYRTRERYAAALYGAALMGQTSTVFAGEACDITTADGRALFAKNHPAKVKGSAQSNLFADAFSNDALMAAECAMQGFRGDNGEILDVAPDTIVIPNDYKLKRDVFAAIGADKDPATANNGFNYNFGRWNVLVLPYLSEFITAGTRPWMLLDSKYMEEYGGAIWLDRLPLTVRSTINDDNDANIWRGRARFVAGYNDWRFASVGGVTGGDTLVSAS